MLMFFFALIILLMPFIFIDSENFLFVDIIKTPEHIKPE
jgi:quinol-cytochrome oxidoreductase complex cytochrome b subunit